MRILMLKSNLGSPCGKVVNEYHAGIEYDTPEDLAQVFIDTGFAKEVEPKPQNDEAGDVVQTEIADEKPKKKGKK